MTTSKLPSGKYRTRIYIDGKQVSFTAETKRESIRLANQAMNLYEKASKSPKTLDFAVFRVLFPALCVLPEKP